MSEEFYIKSDTTRQPLPSITGGVGGGSYFIGQTTIWQRLLGDLVADRVPHALMLCGPAGSGKLALAVAFARALLCEHPHEDVAWHRSWNIRTSTSPSPS